MTLPLSFEFIGVLRYMQRYFSDNSMERHRCAGGLKEEVVPTVGLPTPYTFRRVFKRAPSYKDTGPPFLYGDSDTPPHLVAFYDTLGIRRTYRVPIEYIIEGLSG